MDEVWNHIYVLTDNPMETQYPGLSRFDAQDLYENGKPERVYCSTHTSGFVAADADDLLKDLSENGFATGRSLRHKDAEEQPSRWFCFTEEKKGRYLEIPGEKTHSEDMIYIGKKLSLFDDAVREELNAGTVYYITDVIFLLDTTDRVKAVSGR